MLDLLRFRCRDFQHDRVKNIIKQMLGSGCFVLARQPETTFELKNHGSSRDLLLDPALGGLDCLRTRIRKYLLRQKPSTISGGDLRHQVGQTLKNLLVDHHNLTSKEVQEMLNLILEVLAPWNESPGNEPTSSQPGSNRKGTS